MRDETKQGVITALEQLRPDLVGNRRILETSQLRDLIDSIMMLTLLYLLEERFAITINAHEVTPEHFETIASLSHFVENKRANSHKD